LYLFSHQYHLNIQIFYQVNSNYFEPEKAYCKINNLISESPMVTSGYVSCTPPKEDIKSVEISFDGYLWSAPVSFIHVRKSFFSSLIFDCIFGAIIIVVLLFGALCIKKLYNRRKLFPNFLSRLALEKQ